MDFVKEMYLNIYCYLFFYKYYILVCDWGSLIFFLSNYIFMFCIKLLMFNDYMVYVYWYIYYIKLYLLYFLGILFC